MHLGERTILASFVTDCGRAALTEQGIEAHANGTVGHTTEWTSATYKGGDGVYQLKLRWPSPLADASGVAVTFVVEAWDEIKYLAVGFTDHDAFRHVKIKHPVQGCWASVSASRHDIAFALHNNWLPPVHQPIQDVRLYMKGRPSAFGGTIRIRKAGIFSERIELEPRPIVRAMHSAAVVERLYRYIATKNVDLRQFARTYLETGNFTASGDVVLPWSLNLAVPSRLGESTTFRYMWHSLQSVSFLLLHAKTTGSETAVFAARELTSEWLTRSYFATDPDPRYCWYEHGTAERMISLILMHDAGRQRAFDARFMRRLEHAMIAHAHVLESEAFYASHQPCRFHNHSIFQDIALLVLGAYSDVDSSRHWSERAIDRLADQTRELICSEGSYAILAENSIWYHYAVEGLVRLASDIAGLTSLPQAMSTVAYGMSKWTEFFRYPDGRAPAHGDTFRMPNPIVPTTGHTVAPSMTVLDKAGYAVLKGIDQGDPFMVCQLATSLNPTHKHEDNLSLTVFFAGIEWLIDPSYYSYACNEDPARYLRSAAAHTMMSVVGVPYSPEPGKARLSRMDADPEILRTDGTSTAQENWTFRRRVVVRNDRLDLAVIDDAIPLDDSESERVIRACFHFGDGVIAEESENAVILSHPTTPRRVLLRWHTESFHEASLVKGTAECPPMTGLGFMQCAPTTSLTITLRGECRLEWSLQGL